MKHLDLRLYNNCVGWPSYDVESEGGLVDLIDNSTEVTRAAFLNHVNRDDMKELELRLGYARGELVMANDHHVTYHKGKLHAKWVYYVSHSCIEYVFTAEGTS